MENCNQDHPERYSNFCGLYIKFQGHGKWPRPGEVVGKGRVAGPAHPSHQKWRKACINICKHILKFSNCVLVRVPINNNNYEQPIALFVIILAKNTFRNHHGCNLKLAPTWQQGLVLNNAICICSCQLCIKWEVYLSTMVGQEEATYFIFSY